MKVSTTELNEYRAIPLRLRQMRSQVKFLNFVGEYNDAYSVKDQIEIMRRRRVQLRRSGAY